MDSGPRSDVRVPTAAAKRPGEQPRALCSSLRTDAPEELRD